MTDAEKEALKLWDARFKRWDKFADPYRTKWNRWYKAYRCWAEERDDNLSNLFLPFLFSLVETIEPRLIEAFFGTKPWAGVLPVGPEDVDPANAQEQLIQFQMEERMDFLGKSAVWLKECLMYGTAIGMVPWKLEKHVRQRMERIAVPLPGGYTLPLWNGVRTVNEVTYDDNDFQHIDLSGFFFEPRAQDVKSALYCGHLSYENWAYLKMMEAQGFYQNLAEAEKSANAQQSAVFARLNGVGLGGDSETNDDKQGRTMELMHCFEDDRYTVICNREVVIRDGPNPYFHKRKPYVRIVDIPVQHEFYGIGEIEPNEFLQYGTNDLTNAQMDYILMSILGVFMVDENSPLTAQDLKLHPRKVMRVSSQDNLRMLNEIMRPLDPASFQLPAVLQRMMENASGAGDVSRGVAPNKQATAMEVSTVQQMSEARFRLKVRLINQAGIREVARLMALNNMQFIRRDKAIRLGGADGYLFPKFKPEDLQGSFDFLAAGVAEEPLISKENKRNSLMQLYKLAETNPMWKQREIGKRLAESLDIEDVDSVLKTDEELAQEQAQAQMAAASAQVAAAGGMPPGTPMPEASPMPMPGGGMIG